MIIFLLNRVKLNLRLMVTAAGTLCRSGAGFLLNFLSYFYTQFQNHSCTSLL